jgi:hypothetical protein
MLNAIILVAALLSVIIPKCVVLSVVAHILRIANTYRGRHWKAKIDNLQQKHLFYEEFF